MEQFFDLNYPAMRQAAPVTRAQVSALKAQIAQSWARGKEYRLATGQMLLQLRDLLSRKSNGNGTYGQALSELGIRRSTASDYIRFYNESRGVIATKPKKTRMSGTRTFKDLHGLKDAVGEYLRTRPEDLSSLWAWLALNHPKP